MSDNKENSTNKRNTYYKESQATYKAKCLQIAIRYGVNDNDMKISTAIDQYCKDHNCGRGTIAKVAIVEKLKREGYI